MSDREVQAAIDAQRRIWNMRFTAVATGVIVIAFALVVTLPFVGMSAGLAAGMAVRLFRWLTIQG